MLLHYVLRYWDALLMMSAEMAPYLLLGFLVAGLLRAFVPRRLLSRHFAPRTMGSVAKAAAFGVPLPLCSCGVIPASVSLRREGASQGACASFLIATPQTGVDSIAATYSLMGLPFAVVRPMAALLTAMFGGWLVNRYAAPDEPVSAEVTSPDGQEAGGCGHSDHGHDHGEDPSRRHLGAGRWQSFPAKVRQALEYGFVEMLQDVGKWLVAGLLIAALITVAVPDEWLAALHAYKLLNMLLVLCVAIPMYVCATGSIPIAVSLMAKGLTPGAALVLLMAGPAVNSASMLVVGKVFGRRTLWLYILSVVFGAMAFGLAVDYLLPPDWFAVQGALVGGAGGCALCLTPVDWGWLILLALLLAHALVKMHCRPHGHDLEDAPDAADLDLHPHAVLRTERSVYRIEGMSCNHCKANVERAIREVEGVAAVDVDLQAAKATVLGRHDADELLASVARMGYSAVKAG